MKSEDVKTNIEKINNTFQAYFNDAYKTIKGKNKEMLRSYAQSIYRRWYYSSVLRDTVLTPANGVMALYESCGGHGLEEPYLVMSKTLADSDLCFNLLNYSVDDHPFVKDINEFMATCTPDVDMLGENFLTAEHGYLLLHQLTTWDPFYVEYIKELVFHQGYLQNTPSIIVKKAGPTDKYKDISSLRGKEALNKLINDMISLAADKLSELLMPHIGIDNIRDYLWGMLNKPVAIHDVLEHFFPYIKINLDSHELFESDWLYDDDFDATNPIEANVFVLGVTLDMYFLTPFGHYLKLLRPNYSVKYDLRRELEYIYRIMMEPGQDIAFCFFVPCSSYVLTPLGRELLHACNDEGYKLEEKEILLKFANSGFDTELLTKDEVAKVYEFNERPDFSVIFEIKVKLSRYKEFWKNIEIPGGLSLHDFYQHIAYEFDLPPSRDYCFFTDSSENRFSAYYSPEYKKRAKSADIITIDKLAFPDKHKFCLTLYDTVDPFAQEPARIKQMKLDLEMMKRKEPDNRKNYPRVSRESQAFKEMYMDF